MSKPDPTSHPTAPDWGTVPSAPAGSAGRTPCLVVASGKGGVGKSVVALLLARALARRGLRTLLVDADYNMANLHLLAAVEPARRWESLLADAEAARSMPVPVSDDLWLLPGASGSEVLRQAASLDRARILQRVTAVTSGYDVGVVDVGAGIDGAVSACTVTASRLLLVTAPEPAALADAFVVAQAVHRNVPGTSIDVLVNRVQDETESQLAFDRLRAAFRRFLPDLHSSCAALSEDWRLVATVRNGSSVLTLPDSNPVVLGLDRLVEARAGAWGLEMPVTPAVARS